MLDKQRVRSFLLGGAAGLLAGILLAPKSGRELRGSIADRAGEAHERSRETYFEARERLRERLAEVQEDSYHSREVGADEPGKAEPGMPQRPVLRDVSRNAPGDTERDERSEDLRGRVREIRARLRGRAEGPRDLEE